MAEECGKVDLSQVNARLTALEKSVGDLTKEVNTLAGFIQQVLDKYNSFYEFILTLFGRNKSDSDNRLDKILSEIQGIKKAIDSLSQSLNSKLDGILSSVREQIGSLQQYFGQQLADLLNVLRGMLSNILSELQKFWGQFAEIKQQIGALRAELLAAITAASVAILTAIGTLSAAVLGAIGGLTAAIAASQGAILAAIAAAQAAILAAIAQINLGNNLDTLLQAIQALLALLQGFGKGCKETDLQPVLTAIAGLDAKINSLSSSLLTQIGSLKQYIGQQLADLLNAIRTFLNPTISGTMTSDSCTGASGKHGYSGTGLGGIQRQLDALNTVINRQFKFLCPPTITGTITSQICDGADGRHGYSGTGFKGIELQLSALNTAINRQIKSLCPPVFSGTVEVKDCDGQPKRFGYSGRGLTGLHLQNTAITKAMAVTNQLVCSAIEDQPVPVMPGEFFQDLPVNGQLIISFGTEYPTQKGSLWHISVPNPIPHQNISWEMFEDYERTLGPVMARAYWATAPSVKWSGGWFETEQMAIEFFETKILPLTTISPARDSLGRFVRIVKGKDPKRIPEVRTVRAVKVTWFKFDANGKKTEGYCWRPPRG